MQIIYLDISNKGVVPTIYAKQGDVGRKVQVIFMDSGIPYEIPENAGLSVWYDGDSGDGNYTDIGNKSAIVVENNKVTFELITQMLNNDGEGIVCLIMNVGEKQIGSWNIHYLCEKVPGFDSEAASSYFTAFSESVNKLKNTDKTLTKKGYPADAKATGDKIDGLSAADVGAAPAGHGFGDEMTYIDLTSSAYSGKTFADALETVLATMEGYSCAQIQFYDTSFYSNKFVGKLWKYTANYATLEAICYSGYKAILRKTGGTWQPWEWENPPMEPGAEYRTTERWGGKVVYAKRIDLGTLPNSTNKAVAYYGKGATSVRYEAYIVTSSGNVSPIPYHTSTGTFSISTFASEYAVTVVGQSDVSAHTGFAIVRYTKD